MRTIVKFASVVWFLMGIVDLAVTREPFLLALVAYTGAVSYVLFKDDMTKRRTRP